MELNNQNSFGIGEGELIEIIYELPLPMRLDRWLVSKRPEQSRARVQHLINSGLVLVNYKTAKAKTPLKNGDKVQIWMPPPEPHEYLKPGDSLKISDFKSLAIQALHKASEKVRAKYGFACTRTSEEEEKILSWISNYDPDQLISISKE